ncbi:bZIP transcription factor 53-like [Dioscorea cayenensis subsp. rotundata]|uniref:BZIP transcription factor 53-like n=1 Tax=Dioscorea cayennensis subsp. rotundata TaxID=55577 RepID=A0AB40BH30_DIOCR|nr:bZIP transcription factor 53-like [Dioscorea cayenensis subsp. rotundata]
MASKQAAQSSCSEEDQRKRKRMISNRESARRSRMRKQQHMDDLTNQVAELKNENSQIIAQVNLIAEQYLNSDLENAVLRTQVIELTERLRSLSSVLRFVEEFSGTPMYIPEIPDPLLQPWKLPQPVQPIIASAKMFQCKF